MIPAPAIHEFTAVANGVALRLKSATITLDEEWTPYVQATLLCAVPLDYRLIDPRLAHRATLTIRKLTPANIVLTTKTFDLQIRTRDVDRTAGEMTLTLESDESQLQDWKRPGAPASTTTGTIQDYVAARITTSIPGATILQVGATTALPSPYIWNPGVSAWETCDGLVKLAGLRLWSESGKAFTLAPAPALVGGIINLSGEDDVTLASDKLTRDGSDPTSYADHVVVEYRYTDTTVTPNIQRTQYDSAGPQTDPRKTIFVRFAETRPPAAGGAAAAIRARALTRGRNVQVTAISNYDATPGKTVNIALLGEALITKVIRSVSFRFSDSSDDATMTVATRDS